MAVKTIMAVKTATYDRENLQLAKVEVQSTFDIRHAKKAFVFCLFCRDPLGKINNLS